VHVIDADHKDGAAAAAATTYLNGRLRWLDGPCSCVEAHQRRSCSACRYSRLCTYRHSSARTILKH